MRAVATPNFCKACIETLWLKLLRNITFIDSIEESCNIDSANKSSAAQVKKVISLDLLPLADLRKIPITPKESYSILWKRDQHVLEEFTNKTRAEIDDDVSVGDYDIEIQFSTEEVRVINPVLKNEVKFKVSTPCGGRN